MDERHLAAALRSQGHRIGHNAVASLLRELGYSLQSNRKTRESSNHPDRDAQFGYINAQTQAELPFLWIINADARPLS